LARKQIEQLNQSTADSINQRFHQPPIPLTNDSINRLIDEPMFFGPKGHSFA